MSNDSMIFKKQKLKEIFDKWLSELMEHLPGIDEDYQKEVSLNKIFHIL